MTIQINLGSEIEMELSPKGEPRWQYQSGIRIVDMGYSGDFIYGLIDDIDLKENIATICFINHNNDAFRWKIPLEGHPAFFKEQWALPGFPIPSKQIESPKKCTCGSDVVYGIKNGAHSSWCDISM